VEALSLVNIKATQNETSVLELPKGKSLFSIKKGNYQLFAGLKKSFIKLAVQKGTSEEGTFYISDKVLRSLLVPEGIKTNLKFSNGKLHLGPMLGVFISQNKIEKLKNEGWDSVYWRFQNWASSQGGVVYFFTLEDIHWYEAKVKGYRWTPDRKWIEGYYPMPRIIYDRCFGAEGRAAAYKLREMVKNSNIRVFNNVVKIGKHETYKHLRQYKEFKGQIPAFYSFHPQHLKKCLEQSGSLYLKPDKLYKGEGIVRITNQDEKYILEYRDPEHNNVFDFEDFDNMCNFLKTLFKEEQDYVIQNEINLAKFFGNRFDVRVMLQKIPKSTWEVTGINARLAPIGSVITSPRSGGKVLRIRDVLAKCFPGRENEIIDQIIVFSKKVGHTMEEKFGNLVELGIDLGIDWTGKVWLIEVNGKPLKVSFFKMQDKVIDKVINLSPILYGMAQDWFHISFDNTANQFLPKNYILKELSDGSAERFIYLNDQQLKALKIHPENRLSLQVGPSKFSVEVKKQTFDSTSTTIYLSGKAFNDLTHYHGESLCLVLASSTQIVLGPMVGMSVSDKTIELISEIYEMQKLSQLALEKGIFFYCFRLDRIDWENKQVEAFYFNPQSFAWESKPLPFPEVLYDMATYPFDVDKRQIAKEANKLLRQIPELQPINSKRYFGKWETYQAITFFEQLKPYVPFTEQFTPLTLKNFITLNKPCFVKSNYGSYGKEVFQVGKEDNQLICTTGGKHVEKWFFDDEDSLYSFLQKELGDNCIIQEAVMLNTINDRIFDMRVLAQKDLYGRWVISSINFRIADEGAIVTNYAAGAQEVVIAPENELPHPLLNWKKIKDFSYDMLLALEASFGSLGEVGLDVALDKKGKLWLLEANSKPNTIGYNEVAGEEVLSQVHGLPLDYAKHLIFRMYNNLTL
jgi:glutathione synthase/RimK-type ligase-like ATP-grasp enzyme